MPNNPNISQAQWEVMKVLWDKSPATANEVIEALSAKTSWSPKTIRTLINRLVGKKALGFEKKGRQYHYYPLLNEDECISQQTSSFLDRLRGNSFGALKPMLAAFIKEQQLSDQEIDELKQILDEKGGK